MQQDVNLTRTRNFKDVDFTLKKLQGVDFTGMFEFKDVGFT